MNCNCLLGRNFTNSNSIKLTFNKNVFIEKTDNSEYIVNDIMLIDTDTSN